MKSFSDFHLASCALSYEQPLLTFSVSFSHSYHSPNSTNQSKSVDGSSNHVEDHHTDANITYLTSDIHTFVPQCHYCKIFDNTCIWAHAGLSWFTWNLTSFKCKENHERQEKTWQKTKETFKLKMRWAAAVKQLPTGAQRSDQRSSPGIKNHFSVSFEIGVKAAPHLQKGDRLCVSRLYLLKTQVHSHTSLWSHQLNNNMRVNRFSHGRCEGISMSNSQ